MRRPARSLLRLLAAYAGVLALSACNALAPAEVTPTASLLDQVPLSVPQAPRRDVSLVVETPTARPVYDTTQMAYMQRPHQVAWYGRNQWAETPAQMLQPLLVRTMQATGAFAAVRTELGTEPALTLRSEVIELLQDYTQQPPAARVTLRIRLLDRQGRTLAEREITESQPMAAGDPYAGVLASNEANARALATVADTVLRALP